VILIEAQPCLTGTAILRERLLENPNLEVRCGTRVVEISGDAKVRTIEIINAETGMKEVLPIDGVLVDVGIEPNTGHLGGMVALDGRGQILVDSKLRTKTPTIIAAGDVRSDSPCQVAAAVGDGATAAITAQRVLQGRVGVAGPF
jgi:thioredoxin reductase (NADPH)